MDDDDMNKARAALAALRTRGDVARLVGISPHKLNFYLFRLGSSHRYVKFELKKRGGGVREIRAPIAPIKAAQKTIAAHLAALYEARRGVYGYVEGRSIIGNAGCHSPKRWVLRVDLRDFFPSINFGRVRGLLLARPFQCKMPELPGNRAGQPPAPRFGWASASGDAKAGRPEIWHDLAVKFPSPTL
jgi:hypothetical protein